MEKTSNKSEISLLKDKFYAYKLWIEGSGSRFRPLSMKDLPDAFYRTTWTEVIPNEFSGTLQIKDSNIGANEIIPKEVPVTLRVDDLHKRILVIVGFAHKHGKEKEWSEEMPTRRVKGQIRITKEYIKASQSKEHIKILQSFLAELEKLDAQGIKKITLSEKSMLWRKSGGDLSPEEVANLVYFQHVPKHVR